MLRDDNKGITLVEIVVVVSILVVLASAAVLGVGILSGKQAEQACTTLKTACENNRTVSLGRYKTELVVSDTGAGLEAVEKYYKDNSGTASGTKNVKLCDDKVSGYVSNDGSSWTPIDSSGVTLEFDRSSGALKSSNDVYFRFTKGSYNYDMRIYHLTGKVVIIR